MSHRSFAAALADQGDEAINFDLGEGAEFVIQRPLPGFDVAALAARSEEGGAGAISAFIEFFEAVMDPGDFERFKAECKARRIDLETLMEIGGYVIEQGTGRPTQRRSDSSES